MGKSSRRKFLLNAGATAASSILLKGCLDSPDALNPINPMIQAPLANISANDAPETPRLTLGYFPTVESAPLIIAKEKGLFKKYGMTDVALVQQTDWTSARNQVTLGSAGDGIDGGEWAMPMPYLINEGLLNADGKQVRLYILAKLNTQGNAIAIGNLHQEQNLDLNLRNTADYLRNFPANQNRRFRVAQEFPNLNSDFWLRYWLAASGIDPDSEVEFVRNSLAQTLQGFLDGSIDAVCTSDPWPNQIVAEDFGYIAALTAEIWPFHPEKYLGVRADWVDRHPKASLAVLKAILEAQQWCDRSDNRQELAQILARQYFDIPVNRLTRSYAGKYQLGEGKRNIDNFDLGPLYWRDNRGSVSFPYKSHELWFLVESVRWGFLPEETIAQAPQMIDAVNRQDLWRSAARELEIPDSEIPVSASRGKERFFDGTVFDPEDPLAYLNNLEIKRI